MVDMAAINVGSHIPEGIKECLRAEILEESIGTLGHLQERMAMCLGTAVE